MTMPGVTASTKVACIIGWPAAHSLSPVIHNAGFAAAGLDWIYTAFEVPPAGVEAAVEGIRALGIAGANVTMPHKAAVIPFLDQVSEAATTAGAVNTIVNEGGRLIGENTDGDGFVRFLRRDAGRDPQNSSVLIVGAGGAARAVSAAAGAAGATVRVAARRNAAAAEAARCGGGSWVAWEELAAAAREADVIVNAIPPQADGPSLIASADIQGAALVVDMAYVPPATPLLREAVAAGATARNGLGMLLHQAILAFERWTGGPAPEPEMAAALAAATANPG